MNAMQKSIVTDAEPGCSGGLHTVLTRTPLAVVRRATAGPMHGFVRFSATRSPGRPMLKSVLKSVVHGLGYEVHRRPPVAETGLVDVGFGPYTIEMYLGSTQPGATPGTPAWNGVTNGALSRLVTLAHGKYPDLAAIDVGANVGDTAAVIKTGADIPVLCIEGDPGVYPILERNTRRLPGTTPLHALLGEHEEEMRVAFEKEGWNLTVLPQDAPSTSDGPQAASTTTTVTLTTLDRCMRALPESGRYRLLKVDTEGFDCRILRGGMQFIARVKPIITVEYNRENMDRIGEPGLPTLFALRALGYRDVLVYDESNRLLLATTLHEETVLRDLHDYAPGRGSDIYYYDIVLFHADDADLAERFIESERARRTA